eukprot:NODE_871_length_738_cov_577.809869_g668_i0.p1 GENE.NODE_871_length_738_cov_577.809869_g668_i0~~NODE_871_length_738_cov_577.809869_g668_i0.p1  ORF type:complete len:188 (+),score=18.75 NODE_871_length_738_cov_577.809869_g668_i0:31-594(+)
MGKRSPHPSYPTPRRQQRDGRPPLLVKGVMVKDVSGPAAEAGLQLGDVVTMVTSHSDIHSLNDFYYCVKGIKPGQKVLMKVTRRGGAAGGSDSIEHIQFITSERVDKSWMPGTVRSRPADHLLTSPRSPVTTQVVPTEEQEHRDGGRPLRTPTTAWPAATHPPRGHSPTYSSLRRSLDVSINSARQR